MDASDDFGPALRPLTEDEMDPPRPEPITDTEKAKAGIPMVPYFPKGIERTFHAATRCVPDACIFHNPSAHIMVAWPINIRETTLAERLCPHGIGHPDPDSVAWLDREGPAGAKGTWGVHGCDGCCGERQGGG